MTDRPHSSDDLSLDIDVSVATVYEEMDPFEPYTTGELASVVGMPKRLVRRLLDELSSDGKIRKKEPETDQVIWIREPPKRGCPECGREFEIKYFHPVLQAVQFCPRCGTQLE